MLPLCLLWEEGGRRPDDGLLVISDQWSVIRARLAEEAAGEYRAVAGEGIRFSCVFLSIVILSEAEGSIQR